jgi:hypothetical protein
MATTSPDDFLSSAPNAGQANSEALHYVYAVLFIQKGHVTNSQSDFITLADQKSKNGGLVCIGSECTAKH